MFGKKKQERNQPPIDQPAEKPTPAYLRPDYPYQAIGEPITDFSLIRQTGVLYEIKCLTPDCCLCARSQGVNIPGMYEKMTTDGCPSCKGKEFVVREVDKGRKDAAEKNEGQNT